jgi:hypothetical protein
MRLNNYLNAVELLDRISLRGLSPSTDFLQYLFKRLELIMGVPIYGTYVSANKAFSIQITDANASNGNITGTYSANYSPAGPLSYQGSIGVYGWVFNKGLGRDGVSQAARTASTTLGRAPTRLTTPCCWKARVCM